MLIEATGTNISDIIYRNLHFSIQNAFENIVCKIWVFCLVLNVLMPEEIILGNYAVPSALCLSLDIIKHSGDK